MPESISTSCLRRIERFPFPFFDRPYNRVKRLQVLQASHINIVFLHVLVIQYVDGIINPDANVVTEDSKGNAFGNAQGWPSAVVQWALHCRLPDTQNDRLPRQMHTNHGMSDLY